MNGRRPCSAYTILTRAPSGSLRTDQPEGDYYGYIAAVVRRMARPVLYHSVARPERHFSSVVKLECVLARKNHHHVNCIRRMHARMVRFQDVKQTGKLLSYFVAQCLDVKGLLWAHRFRRKSADHPPEPTCQGEIAVLF